ncbi:hypothetical protein TIFTF001_049002 [Ficus carica]|uniref:BHLH domain-containing protein n=1 Tax=Ficus carica TaxID=3494 RepID=A0AA87Z6T9_FICCA|nr:hypothetical protein TIFTF001_049002 [Ficus carica]
MLALSPPLSSTNFAYWPLEDPIGHDDQNYFYRDIEPANSDQSVFLNFPTPPPSDQRSLAELDHQAATPSTTADVTSSDLSTAVKKLNHNASERDRRKKINHFIPATVSRILKYIPELQQLVEELVRKRDEILLTANSRQQGNLQVHQEINKQTKTASRASLSSVSASQLNNKEVVVQISTLKLDKNPLSEMLHNLEKDGLSVLNASSFESFGGRIFHNLHIQLAKIYKNVVATDTSTKPLEFALQLPNVQFKHTSPTMSISEQVKWVLKKPHRVFVARCYTEPKVNSAVDAVFQPLALLGLKVMDLVKFFAYIRSWSAYQTAKDKGFELLRKNVIKRFECVWSEDGNDQNVTKFPVHLKIGELAVFSWKIWSYLWNVVRLNQILALDLF